MIFLAQNLKNHIENRSIGLSIFPAFFVRKKVKGVSVSGLEVPSQIHPLTDLVLPKTVHLSCFLWLKFIQSVGTFRSTRLGLSGRTRMLCLCNPSKRASKTFFCGQDRFRTMYRKSIRRTTFESGPEPGTYLETEPLKKPSRSK
jgi:hypothetical protein